VVGFLGGFYEDLYLPSYMGVNSLATTAVGFLAGEAGERLRREQTATQAAIFLVLTGVRELMRNVLSLGARVFDLLGPVLLHDLLLVTFTTAVGVGIGVLGRNVLFGERRFAESVTARRRIR
jgi:rod shape-determining protein MreD